MIIDTHVHVWSDSPDPRRSESPAETGPRRPSGLAEADEEMTELQVCGIVLVQSANEMDHNDELLQAAEASARPARVVGWLPLDQPAQTARALERYANRPALVGVRHWLTDRDDPGFLQRSEVAHSLELVAAAGLSLDIMPTRPALLGQVTQIARQHPSLRIIIDTLGLPPIAERRMQPWTDHLAHAAAAPSVSIKVSGLYRVSGDHTDPDAWRPYVQTAVDLFGPDRIMIGSNWPTMAAYAHSYSTGMKALLASFDDLIDIERDQVLSGTASRVYHFE